MGCIFCSIAEGAIPANKVYEDDEMLAFLDIEPKMPVHILFIPKNHIDSLAALCADDEALVGRILVKMADVARERGLDSFRLVSNAGRDAGQTVDHLHFHLLAGGTMTNMV